MTLTTGDTTRNMPDQIACSDRDPDADTIGLFLEAASRHAGDVAVSSATGTLNYAEFAARVRGLAGAIAGCKPRARVLIALPPGADAYAAMFATGLAGGVYAPVNTNAPLARQRAISARFAPDIVVATRSIREWLAADAPHAIMLDPDELSEDGCLPGIAPLTARVPREARHALAYVIFTSGSTGKPKGVEITRAALDHYVAWLGAGLDIRPGDRVSQYANIAFDLSVMEIYGALCRGASLHPPAGAGDRLFPAALMRRENLTHWISVPSVVSLMRQAGELTADYVASIRRFVFCGEALTPSHVNELLQAAPEALIQNTYGPTEATVSMTSVLLSVADLPAMTQASVALGAPIPGMEVRLVGGPHADEGELVLLGPQLARGYLGDPDTTAGAFRSIETASGTQRAYFTGDWARRIDGELYFQARTDFQIKHKGYRIELGDIQSALAATGAAESVVFASEGKLVAIVESDGPTPAVPEQLRHALKRLIDPHAVPDELIVVRQLPRNDNDKIDRNAALALYASATDRHFIRRDQRRS